MLSKEELSRYGTATMTNVFLDRVFQECLTYDGEMDYKTYLDFVLALENRKEPAALQYIFKLLDIENKGYLNVFSLNYFFRAIQELMKIHGQDPVSFQDVKVIALLFTYIISSDNIATVVVNNAVSKFVWQ